MSRAERVIAPELSLRAQPRRTGLYVSRAGYTSRIDALEKENGSGYKGLTDQRRPQLVPHFVLRMMVVMRENHK